MVAYVNSDYGKGLSDSFVNAFKKLGGEITETNYGRRRHYSAEVATLDSAGGEALAVFSYVDQGGPGIIQPAIDSGAFDRFILADGMFGDRLHTNVDGDLTGSFGTVPGSASNGAELFKKIASGAGINSNGPFIGESYDAAALLVLAMQRARSTSGGSIADNPTCRGQCPGTKIFQVNFQKASIF